MFKCVVCGKPASFDSVCMFTHKPRCSDPKCFEAAQEYAKRKDEILKDFSNEKERVLRPLKDKLDTELFLIEREYLNKDVYGRFDNGSGTHKS